MKRKHEEQLMEYILWLRKNPKATAYVALRAPAHIHRRIRKHTDNAIEFK